MRPLGCWWLAGLLGVFWLPTPSCPCCSCSCCVRVAAYFCVTNGLLLLFACVTCGQLLASRTGCRTSACVTCGLLLLLAAVLNDEGKRRQYDLGLIELLGVEVGNRVPPDALSVPTYVVLPALCLGCREREGGEGVL